MCTEYCAAQQGRARVGALFDFAVLCHSGLNNRRSTSCAAPTHRFCFLPHVLPHIVALCTTTTWLRPVARFHDRKSACRWRLYTIFCWQKALFLFFLLHTRAEPNGPPILTSFIMTLLRCISKSICTSSLCLCLSDGLCFNPVRTHPGRKNVCRHYSAAGFGFVFPLARLAQ